MTDNSRIALVTGAGKRIGKAIALDLAAHGWAVGVHYQSSAAEASEVVDAIVAGGGRAVALAADLTDAAAVAALIPACNAALGPPSLLVNNASLFLPDEVGSLEVSVWDRHHAVNLRAPVMLAQALAAHLPAGVPGNVINILDQRVLRPMPLFFSYGIAKSALYAATTMLAQALAPNIRVNGIGPGPTLQSIHQTPEQFAAQERSVPLQHGTRPEEIAAAIRFILAAGAMTGQMIALDGGQHLAWRPSEAVIDDVAPATAKPAANHAANSTGLRHVLVRQLELSTVIGVHDEEKRAPQRVWVSLDLCVREAGPAVSDRLDDVLDYGEVVRRTTRIAQAGHVNLVETLAERIAADCLTDPRVASVRVRIEKPDVITNAKAVGVEIVRP